MIAQGSLMSRSNSRFGELPYALVGEKLESEAIEVCSSFWGRTEIVDLTSVIEGHGLIEKDADPLSGLIDR